MRRLNPAPHPTLPMIYDITLPLDADLAGWPGDAGYQFKWTCTRAEGASVNLGQIALSIHSGTHVDASYHFDDAGARVDRLSLDPFIGPARVVDVHNRPVIRREDLAGVDLDGVGRLLLRTGAWTDRTRFPEAIPVLAEDVPKWLRQRGIVLLGLDVPSVDVLDSKTLPIHHALGGCGIAILESLDLAGVPEGVYELIALPLRLVGADGSPVRAILRSLE